ncbi:MAG TPA: hypothetical protein VIC24_14535 [Gemmatimonadaceae bacterium]
MHKVTLLVDRAIDVLPLSSVGPNNDRRPASTQCAARGPAAAAMIRQRLPASALAAILHNMHRMSRRANRSDCIGYETHASHH